MRLHTNLITPQILAALLRAKDAGHITPDVHFAVFIARRSRTHENSFEIQLGTHDRDSLPAGYTDQHGRTLRVRRGRGGHQGAARYAATWHEWGWFIAQVFAADPDSRWGSDPARSRHPWGYFSPEDFHVKTSGQFRLPARRAAAREPGHHEQETSMLKAYREDGTEVRAGDTITDLYGDTAIFYAATRAPDEHRTGLVQVNDPFGPEYYMTVFGLTVRNERAPAAQTDGQSRLPAQDASRRRKPMTETLAAQEQLTPGQEGWWPVYAARAADIQPGDLIAFMNAGQEEEHAILAVPDTSPWRTRVTLTTCYGETLWLGGQCPVAVRRRGTSQMIAGLARPVM
jgi:hypothetical protein